ncbi:hypothetical protein OV203_19150 [Nannocystis sp. ILAH1]|uniref:hypothetical protein n=1 Tax=Nannocystis sp. ILAH1 TaxID=2996789 RepID=UPI002271FAF4|nr:hypothetical protein [Nannocystis sp. ILAH1]MCY0989264.1 hypothetical protein [Nannocystis sp. ILAH1]
MLRSTLSFLTLTFLFLTGACDPKPGDTDSGTASASTTDASTTDAATTDASTTDESPTSSATEDGATTDSDEPTVATTSDDTGSETTGPVDPEHQSACEAACQLIFECEGGGDVPLAECAQDCASEFQGLEPECVPLNLTFVQCIAQLTCAELDGEEEPCAAELEAVEVCAGVGDPCTVGVSDEGDEGCGVSTFCPDMPTQEIFCDAETCVCSVDGVETAQCPADNVCAEGDAIFDKMATCCKFE